LFVLRGGCLHTNGGFFAAAISTYFDTIIKVFPEAKADRSQKGKGTSHPLMG